jgi:hypothetical protein
MGKGKSILVACLAIVAAIPGLMHAQGSSTTTGSSSVPGPAPLAVPPGTDEALRAHLKTAREAHDASDFDAEVTAWRSAYMEAVNLKNPDALFQIVNAMDQMFKENDRPLERVATLKSGGDLLRKFGGAGPIWAAQVDIALACALEDQGKRHRVLAPSPASTGTRSAC